MKKEKFQSVWITLSDGTKHCFTGRAITKKGDKRRITNIYFTEPEELPENYYLEIIKRP